MRITFVLMRLRDWIALRVRSGWQACGSGYFRPTLHVRRLARTGNIRGCCRSRRLKEQLRNWENNFSLFDLPADRPLLEADQSARNGATGQRDE